MTFVDFCRALGIVIETEPPVGRWVRLPTVTHPRKRNGAVKFMGDHGFAQEHATMTDVAVWRPDADAPAVDKDAIAMRAKHAQAEIEKNQAAATERAQWILSQCELRNHPYLEKKGFPAELGNVWDSETGKLLIVPMRHGREVVGCQMIDESGGKKFLFGQRTSDTAFVFDNKGPSILCEGFATGLSIRAAMAALKARYTIYVCFSAGNMARMAKHVPMGLVVADNDESGTGERVARETGWPYYMPPTVGHDFNDFHQSSTLFKCSQALRSALLST